MEIETFGSFNETSPVARRTGLSQEDFLQVLLTQLSFQDPLSPMDNTEFIAQFAQLTELQQIQELSEKVDEVITFQSYTQAMNLVGRSVEIATDTSQELGRVTSVSFRNGNPELSLTTNNGTFLTGITIGQILALR